MTHEVPMERRYLKIYIVVVLVMTLIMFATPLATNYLMSVNSEDLYYLDTYIYNNEKDSMIERKLTDDTVGLHTYKSFIPKNILSEGYLDLIVPRIRGGWHKIYFNDIKIGLIGSENDMRNHLWNGVYRFQIPSDYMDEENYITFETFSEYKIGFGDLPAFITNDHLGNRLYFLLGATFSNFYMIIIGALTSFALMEMLLFFFTKDHDNHYILYPLGVLLICIYLLDYVVLAHPLMSGLIYKKIIILALYGSAAIISFGLSKLFKQAFIKWFGLIQLLVATLLVALASDLIMLSYFYYRLNFSLSILVTTWVIISFKHYLQEKNMLSLLISVSGVLLFIPTLYDTLMLFLLEGRHTRLSVYGIVYFTLAILFISLFNYLEVQKKNFSDSKYLELESIRLKKALITDELTGLYNHRYFFELYHAIIGEYRTLHIALLDIDEFRQINEIKGHTNGDKILKEISSLIRHFVGSDGYVFRYGGEEFVIIYLKDDFEDLCNSIRLEIVKNQLLQDWSGYLPLTVSMGIVSYPTDGIEPKTLIDKCERAVTYGKLHGKNKVFCYEESMKEKLEGNESIVLQDQMLVNFIYTLSSVIDMKDPYTGKHSEEVSRYSMLIGDVLSLDETQSYALRMGGLLHDFGKLSIPDQIIEKKGKLSDEEFKLIKNHPVSGYDIVKHIVDDHEVLECVRYHHERYDGNGYPDGLKGLEIPLLSRIICVADSYHAMVSNRSYRKSLGHEYAVSELINNKGTQFDPMIVDAFLSVLEK